MSGRLPDHVVRLPVSLQTWSDLTFLHWRFPPSTVQALLPPGLLVDVLDGSAWVGLTPFRMRNVRLPNLPPPPAWADFPELNVRTYVRGPDGHDGLWFFHLFCTSRSFISALRAIGLPYRHATAHVGGREPNRAYRFTRRDDPSAEPLFAARVQVGPALADEDRTMLLDSLTGRWNAYARPGGRLLRVPVEHEPWPLRSATLEALTCRWEALGLPEPREEPLVHFSPGVNSRFGPPTVVRD
jgi:uncharacterized protein YqjF (DUF2071 family)